MLRNLGIAAVVAAIFAAVVTQFVVPAMSAYAAPYGGCTINAYYTGEPCQVAQPSSGSSIVDWNFSSKMLLGAFGIIVILLFVRALNRRIDRSVNGTRRY